MPDGSIVNQGRADPIWRAELLKVRASMGKGKKDLVASMGEPTNVQEQSSLTAALYEYKIPGGTVAVSFNDASKVARAEFTIDYLTRVGPTWRALELKEGKMPEPDEPDMAEVERFWIDRESFRRQLHPTQKGVYPAFEVAVHHLFEDNVEIGFTAYSPQCPVRGSVKFNTATDRKEFTPEGKNFEFGVLSCDFYKFTLSMN